MLWPASDHARHERWPGRERHTIAAGDGTAAVSGVGVSAKRALGGRAVGAPTRMEERLVQVARTMPEIGIPHPRAPAGSLPPTPESEAAPEREAAPDREAAPEIAPEPVALARPDRAIEPAAPPPAPAAPLDRARGAGAVTAAPAAILPPEPGGRGTPTWLRNAVAPVVDHRPALAVVIDDLGMNRRAAAALNRLPAPLTLAFLPYATKLDEQAQAARAAGHELLVHVPMEPRGREWPGPNALTSELTPDQLVAQLGSQLDSFRGFVGINNHMGSLLTADPERMAIVMAELRRRGLLFLDSRTTPQSVAGRQAARMGVPYAERDVFIDNQLDLEAVLAQLARAERIAAQHGHAVVIGHPHEVTIEALEIWLPTLEARGIALVPISTIVARKSCSSGIILVAETCARYAVAATTVPVEQ
ncbi:MAG TPA: divergent polysaccharide deacetylase family protein [Geminicoccaceae bacterium]|nr:divergent polysaccharide deacetylase family protein [Geminicoccaceae bacterium]